MIYSLAPMATLSHEALRLLIHSFGDPTEYFAEMIQATSYLAGGKFEPWYTRTRPDTSLIVWQLTCGSSEPIVEASKKIVSEIGGKGIDINMGCCAPPILQQGAGFSWVKKERQETLAMIKAVKKAIGSVRLSVKTRLGEESSDTEKTYEKLKEFVLQLVDCGVELITLHPRTEKEKLKHLARWQFVERLASEVPCKIVGNGDIHSATEAVSFVKRYKCAGAMIGRQAITTPWIFAQINGKLFTTTEGSENLKKNTVNIEETGLKFLEFLQESQPFEFYLTRAKRFFFYFCDNLQFSHYEKMKIQNANSLQEIEIIWKDYFVQNLNEKYLILENNE